jgi:hypothetical protein
LGMTALRVIRGGLYGLCEQPCTHDARCTVIGEHEVDPRGGLVHTGPVRWGRHAGEVHTWRAEVDDAPMGRCKLEPPASLALEDGRT